MPQQSHRDHGVTGQHWLLDQELASLSKGRAARPAALERVEVPLPAIAAIGDGAVPPRHNFVLFVAGLVTALLVYALLSNAAVVGALDDVFPNEGVRPLRITASGEPRASELAELRGLLALRPTATVERGSRRSNAPPTQKSKSGTKSNPSGPEDGVLPPLPPPSAPPPVIPAVPPEIPALEVRPLLELEAAELPNVPELP